MPILNDIDRKTHKGKALIISIYAFLCIGGAAMVYPFMVTITGSFGTSLDYHRREPVPEFLWSRPDRLLRTLTQYAPPSSRNPMDELRGYFPDMPESWRTWRQIGDDKEGSRIWAASQLADLDNPKKREAFARMSLDLADFLKTWPVQETVLAYKRRDVSNFLRYQYETIESLNQAWYLAIDSFNEVLVEDWRAPPLDQQRYMPQSDARYQDLLAFREAYRDHRFTPHLGANGGRLGLLRPAPLAHIWERFAEVHFQPEELELFSPVPFPVPNDAPPLLLDYWHLFLVERFPLRHVEIEVTAYRQVAFQKFLESRFETIENLKNLLVHETNIRAEEWSSWADVKLTKHVPAAVNFGRIWMDFIRTHIPPEQWQIRNTLSEKAFQQFALERHGSLDAVNMAYQLDLKQIEHLRLPFRGAFLHTFNEFEWRFVASQTLGNYYTALDNLVLRGNAVPNTIILIGLTMLLTLTVNPLAAYAMSRFRLRFTNQLMLFFVGTMAFPAAVSAIPGFLLLRDLGLLNTFAALTLPTAVNGMAIFLLKGFFDSLPQELYEAATIDGASEMQIFRIISLPLVKPILAVNALNAFIIAYNGWEWAIIVAQDKSMWTLAVWTYQFSQTFASEPYLVMSAFLLNSLPVFLVFCFCQKIIMRGIVLPQMK